MEKSTLIGGLIINKICELFDIAKRPDSFNLIMEEAMKALDSMSAPFDADQQIRRALSHDDFQLLLEHIHKYASDQIYMDQEVYLNIKRNISDSLDKDERLTKKFEESYINLEPFVERQEKIFTRLYEIVNRDLDLGNAHIVRARYEAIRSYFTDPRAYVESENERLSMSLALMSYFNKLFVINQNGNSAPWLSLEQRLVLAATYSGINNALYKFQKKIVEEESENIFDLSYKFD